MADTSSKASDRLCVFCSSEIAEDDPPEHVVPQWLRRFRPKHAVFSHQPSIIVRGASPEPTTQGHTFVSKTPSITTDVVCRSCNGGWMSDLETRGSQLFPPMIEGDAKPLTPDDHAFTATWGTKTVMMWQTIEPGLRTARLDAYKWLRTHKTPPPFTRVRIGHYIGNRLPFIQYGQENLIRTDIPEPSPDEFPTGGYRAILTIGRLLIEVFAAHDENTIARNIRFPEMTGPALIDSWPGLGPSHWPPRYALDDAGMLRFLNMPDHALPAKWVSGERTPGL